MLKKYNLVARKLVEVDEAAPQGWVYTNPTLDEQRLLVEKFQIDEHTLASALDSDEQPRLEFEP